MSSGFDQRRSIAVDQKPQAQQRSESRYVRVASGHRHDGVDYLGFIRLLNGVLKPQSYLGIGTHSGDSVKTVSCDAICVDPSFKLDGNITAGRRRTLLFQMSSDEFFQSEDVRTYFPKGVDLVFLDGLHRAEYLLRDFINAERVCHKRSLIIIHDCLPLNARMANRTRQRGGEDEPAHQRDDWTGDVWKIIPILKGHRPDLRVNLVNCPPTGLVIVSRLDPTSNILGEQYFEISESFLSLDLNPENMKTLWSSYPMLDSAKLSEASDDLTALFTIR